MSIRRQSMYLSLLGLCAGGAAAARRCPGHRGHRRQRRAHHHHHHRAAPHARPRRTCRSRCRSSTPCRSTSWPPPTWPSMNGYIPGLAVSGEQPTQPGYSLRGISVSDFGIGTDSPIGIYQDGVYAGKTGGALLLFNDVRAHRGAEGPAGHAVRPQQRGRRDLGHLQRPDRHPARGCQGALGQLRQPVLRGHGECASSRRTWMRA